MCLTRSAVRSYKLNLHCTDDKAGLICGFIQEFVQVMENLESHEINFASNVMGFNFWSWKIEVVCQISHCRRQNKGKVKYRNR